MHIFITTTGYGHVDGGGIGTYVNNLVQGLANRGHQITVVSPQIQGKDSEFSQEGNISVYWIPKRHTPLLERVLPGVGWAKDVYRVFRRVNKAHKIDVAEFPNWEAGGLFVQLLTKVKTIVRVHTPYFETLQIDKGTHSLKDKSICFQERLSCQLATKLSSSTECHAGAVAKEYQMPIEAFTILPLGILDKNSNQQNVVPNSGAVKLLYVSRLENRKGTLYFLEALKVLINKGYTFSVDIIGSDRKHAPDNQSFRAYTEDKLTELKGVVTFHGFVNDLDEFYRNADLFVVPSIYESFGLIYAEAMMWGLPSIATTGGGIPEVVSDGFDGLLAKPKDVESLVEKIERLIVDEKLRSTMALNARKSFEEKFEQSLFVKRTESLYTNALSSRG